MGLLIEQERRAWKRQPQTRQRLNPASPYFAGLLFHAPLHPGWGMLDLVSGAPCTKTGLGTSAVTPAGVMPVFGSGSYADFTAPADFDGSLPFTIAWVQQPISPAGYSTVLDVRPPVNAAKSFLIYQSASDSTYQFVVGPRDGGGTGKQAQFAMGLQVSGQLDVYVLVAPSGLATASSAYVLYRNGVRQAAAVASPDFGAASPTGMRVGSVLGSPGDPFEGGLVGVTIWQRALDDRAASAWLPEKLYSPRRTRRYITTIGGGPAYSVSSLSAAVQAARSATAGLAGGVQAPRTATAVADAAVASAKTATASLSASVSAVAQAVASLAGAVQAAKSASAGAAAVVQLAESAAAALDLAVQEPRSAAASLDGQVQAESSATVGLSGFVQAGSGLNASMSAAVLASAMQTAGLDAALVVPAMSTVGMSAALRAAAMASAAIDAAVSAPVLLSLGLDAQVQDGSGVAAAISAAITEAKSALASVDAAISRAATAQLSLSAAVSLEQSMSAAANAAILSSAASALGLGAYVSDPSAGGGAGAAEVWSFLMANGKTAEQNVVEIHAMLLALTPDVIASAVWNKTLP